MLILSAQQITKITDNDSINSENYLELITYIDNLYDVLNILKKVISTKDIIFQPTFKGKYTCAKHNIPTTLKESELKVFAVKTNEFLEDHDNTKKEILFDILTEKCEKDSIKIDNDIVSFILI